MSLLYINNILCTFEYMICFLGEPSVEPDRCQRAEHLGYPFRAGVHRPAPSPRSGHLHDRAGRRREPSLRLLQELQQESHVRGQNSAKRSHTVGQLKDEVASRREVRGVHLLFVREERITF